MYGASKTIPVILRVYCIFTGLTVISEFLSSALDVQSIVVSSLLMIVFVSVVFFDWQVLLFSPKALFDIDISFYACPSYNKKVGSISIFLCTFINTDCNFFIYCFDTCICCVALP